MNGYLVPSNSKKGNLILNMFRPFDLIMFCVGAGVSLFMLMIMPSDSTIGILIACLPVAVTGLLVVPIPNYHNVLCAIQSIFKFFSEKMKGNYVWKGWCFYEKFGREK